MDKSLGLDEETYDDLCEVAKKNGRNLIGQIRFWIAGERK